VADDHGVAWEGLLRAASEALEETEGQRDALLLNVSELGEALDAARAVILHLRDAARVVKADYE
jgi:hypothetical protein